MNEWIRNPNVENNFQELHGIKPEIYFCKSTARNTNKVKLVYKNREFILTEVLEKGLTKITTLEYEGKMENFNRVYNAEKRIKEIV